MSNLNYNISDLLLDSVGLKCLDLSWVRVVLGTGCPGYELSWARVVLGTSCPDPKCLITQLFWDTVNMNCSHLTQSFTMCKTGLPILLCFAWRCDRLKCLSPRLLIDTMSDKNTPRLTCCITVCQTKCPIPCRLLVRLLSTQYPWQSGLVSSTYGIPKID